MLLDLLKKPSQYKIIKISRSVNDKFLCIFYNTNMITGIIIIYRKGRMVDTQIKINGVKLFQVKPDKLAEFETFIINVVDTQKTTWLS